MYFSYGIFVDNRVPNFWGEFDSCLNFYTKCTPPLCFAQQNIGEVSARTEGLTLTIKNPILSFQPLSSKTTVSSVSHLLLTQHKGETEI